MPSGSTGVAPAVDTENAAVLRWRGDRGRGGGGRLPHQHDVDRRRHGRESDVPVLDDGRLPPVEVAGAEQVQAGLDGPGIRSDERAVRVHPFQGPPAGIFVQRSGPRW